MAGVDAGQWPRETCVSDGIEGRALSVSCFGPDANGVGGFECFRECTHSQGLLLGQYEQLKSSRHFRFINFHSAEYSFHSKGELVSAKKFRAVLTSSNPQEYMYGSVPFNFKNRNAAVEAEKKFTDGSVWEISAPAFDHKCRALYVGCPKKAVLLLQAPTVIRRVEQPGDSAPLQAVWPNLTVHPPCNLQETVKMLKMIRQSPGNASDKSPATTLDVCGKFMELTEQKETLDKKQNKLMVAELVLVDDSNHSFRISVWDDAYDLLTDVSRGEGISLVGLTAMKDSRDDGFKVNAWHNSLHVVRGGDRADVLSQMPASSTNEFVPATSTFTPQTEPVEVAGEALHTCAAALAKVPKDMQFLSDKKFQINRCVIEAPISRGAIVSDKGNLYIRAIMQVSAHVDLINALKADFERVWFRSASMGVTGTAAREESNRKLETDNASLWKNIVRMRDELNWNLEAIKSALDGEIDAEQKKIFHSHVVDALTAADLTRGLGAREGANLDFRLDKETAIVMVSSLESEGGSRAAAVESVRKIEPHSVSQIRALFDIEWKTALTDLGTTVLDSHTSPARPEYCEPDGQPPARKARRVDSDAKSPSPAL